MADDEYIDADNWLDLWVGQTGTSFGRVDQIAAGSGQGVYSQPAIVLDFADRSQLLVHITPTGYFTLCDNGALRRAWLGAHVLLRLRRTEDGVEGIAMRKVAEHVWTPLTNTQHDTTVSHATGGQDG